MLITTTRPSPSLFLPAVRLRLWLDRAHRGEPQATRPALSDVWLHQAASSIWMRNPCPVCQ